MSECWGLCTFVNAVVGGAEQVEGGDRHRRRNWSGPARSCSPGHREGADHARARGRVWTNNDGAFAVAVPRYL